jgi:hypothetical protein
VAEDSDSDSDVDDDFRKQVNNDFDATQRGLRGKNPTGRMAITCYVLEMAFDL